MSELQELMADGERLRERIERREALAASRAAVAADEGRFLKGRTVEELRAELETSLNFIVAELEAVNARVAAPQTTGRDDADGEFPMLSEAVFSRYGLQDRVAVLRALLRDLSKAVREQRKRIDALETRQTAADSNARRGIQ